MGAISPPRKKIIKPAHQHGHNSQRLEHGLDNFAKILEPNFNHISLGKKTNNLKKVDWPNESLTHPLEWDSRRNDVAILGCGAYGMPLGLFARSRGMSAIYVGGFIGPILGIRSQKYDPVVNESINEYWTRPLREDVPADPSSVDAGAYW